MVGAAEDHHCPAGGSGCRCLTPPSRWLSPGTFCALDICLSQLQDVGTLNIYQTVLRMRSQRAFSIQTPEQYHFCYAAVLEHAQRQGLLLADRGAHDKSSPGH